MNVKVFVILITVVILLTVIEQIRREKMTFKYSLSWLFGCTIVLVLGLNSHLLHILARFAGFQLASNFIFFLFLVFFIMLTLFLTIHINEQNNRTETLAQAMGIIEYKLKKLAPKEKNEENHKKE
ncbi:MAG: hypothetical protein A3G33_02875 [Omnitrophica bacterium RIFCSPLOWO2_12_FULL_44_17]|uniref:DUF2304 domain-containing protein n=1 Tax=Candidatus Danuiimicrobium aquiferis TaxID=1801832 RepID=A0A1G1KVW2_9BACT|nr:MAG: hypothetical protein A3B72_04355 [Omnitrophica bacterium RIFCSPHIGHO2_02_FULL_45_28]OGW90871.1 MAG: hypothetical protein A3E74_01580 [Omnitrophica bacterium RIFCSPHIGHO2_12_FULL_44_12]OGW96922.1 MAG: hypothetical protein A3G33_02875 [Omnitrophica bacterium RIFCSPLOWO2_12_FULL_44_17]OGX03942.1 MAG: hypothetical protein A3J12_03540 [Omnitrophica bacterium RIFCSPLOWO2_02_FULL_44_11]